MEDMKNYGYTLFRTIPFIILGYYGCSVGMCNMPIDMPLCVILILMREIFVFSKK